MYPVPVALILIIAIAAFAYSFCKRGVPLFKARTSHRSDHFLKRTFGVLRFFLLQEKVALKDLKSGIFHALIFWGFCILLIHTIMIFGIGLSKTFHIPGLTGNSLHIYYVTANVFEIIVALACAALLIRRIVFRPKRLTLSLEANIILLAILGLMISGFFLDRSSFRTGELTSAQTVIYFAHIIGIAAFLNYLPYGKHFHIITALPNIFFRNLGPTGALTKLDVEDENATSFGVDKIAQFDRKALLDLYSCTECGRCQEQCPAYSANKPLSPKEFTMSLRGKLVGDNRSSSLMGDTISADSLWSCTTCHACEEACPLFIEHVQKIVDMRRHLVLMKGELPPDAQKALKNIESNGNPWGLSSAERTVWIEDLPINTLARNSDVEYLFFVGCAGSFDERIKNVTRAFAQLLIKAEVSFGILGEEEPCCGDSARRLGNEYLFQTLAKQNIEKFGGYGVKKILTTCPHCYNTLKNEYPQMGGRYEVSHHTEFLHNLIKTKKLNFKTLKFQNFKTVVTYHDPCYLGRYNGIYNSPRQILKACGHKLAETPNSKETSRCCGAGGGLMWIDDKNGTRLSHQRLEDFNQTGAPTIATSCPFCLTMLNDAAKEMDKGNDHAVKDISEILLHLVL